MANQSMSSILSQLGVKTQQKNQEPKKAQYKRDVYGLDLVTSKSEYYPGLDCDAYISGNAMHFQTAKKHGEYGTGYNTIEEAYAVIQAMAKLRVPGIWDIAQNIETKKYEIIPAPRYNNKK